MPPSASCRPNSSVPFRAPITSTTAVSSSPCQKNLFFFALVGILAATALPSHPPPFALSLASSPLLPSHHTHPFSPREGSRNFPALRQTAPLLVCVRPPPPDFALPARHSITPLEKPPSTLRAWLCFAWGGCCLPPRLSGSVAAMLEGWARASPVTPSSTA